MINNALSVEQPQISTPNALEDCSICLEPKDIEQSNLTTIEPCLHTFHTPCIERWRTSENQNSSNCPDCRGPISFAQRIGEVVNTARPVISSMPLGNFLFSQFGNTASEGEAADQAVTSRPETETETQPSSTCSSALKFVSETVMGVGVSAAVGAFGSVCLRSSAVASAPKLVALESLVGSAITSIPVGIVRKLMGNSGSAETYKSTLAVGVEALNAYLGNQLLNHSNVQPGAAAAAGATGAVTLPLAVAGAMLSFCVASLSVACVANNLRR
ncbi:MAG: RING finger domain-containing protein [Gammaproteobacteria bacterium]